MGIGPKFSTGESPRLGEPNPHRFEIVTVEQIKENVVAMVRYPDATEFGGVKILVYRNTLATAVRTSPVLDPHFLAESFYPKPFARFEASEAGLVAAKLLAEML